MSKKRKEKYHHRRLALLDKQGRERQIRIEIDVLDIARRVWPELFENEEKKEPGKLVAFQK